MIGSVREIKILRKRHNLTQNQLAKLSGVSQSLIAKVEAGIIDPSYSKFRKIYDSLTSIKEKNEPKAGDFMNGKIISVQGTSLLKDAVKRMKHNKISQLPVVNKKGEIKGLISETDVLEKMQKGKNINKTEVSEIMENVPPTVPKETPLKIVVELLRVNSLVVITDKGSSKGVITKSDVLNLLANEKF